MHLIMHAFVLFYEAIIFKSDKPIRTKLLESNFIIFSLNKIRELRSSP